LEDERKIGVRRLGGYRQQATARRQQAREERTQNKKLRTRIP